MKLKPSKTRKVNIKPTTKKIDPEVVAVALGADPVDSWWVRRDEIRTILSETDPQKYPNTIPEKTLSAEEQLEFIHEIVSGLSMDFSDAEHQIHYHADTLPDVFRDIMKALEQINHTMCMSVEAIDKMENGTE